MGLDRDGFVGTSFSRIQILIHILTVSPYVGYSFFLLSESLNVMGTRTVPYLPIGLVNKAKINFEYRYTRYLPGVLSVPPREAQI